MGQFFIANQYAFCPLCDFELYLVRKIFLPLGTKSRDENCPLYRKIWVWTKAEHKKQIGEYKKASWQPFWCAFGKRGCPSLLWPSLGPDGPREGHSSSGHPLLPQSPKKCLEDFLSSLSYFLCSTLVQIHTILLMECYVGVFPHYMCLYFTLFLFYEKVPSRYTKPSTQI